MLKTLLLSVAAASAVATSALARPTVSVDTQFGDAYNANGPGREYRLGLADSFNALNHDWNYSVTAQALDFAHGDPLDTQFAASVGPKFSSYYGFTPSVNLRLGEHIVGHEQSQFYGFNVGVAHQIYGPFTGSVSYTRDLGFDTRTLDNETLKYTVSYAFTPKDAVDFNVSHSVGSAVLQGETVGLSYKHAF